MSHPQLSLLGLSGLYADSRSYGYQGPTRNVRFHRATPSGGCAISKSEDGVRCAVTGKESLRIIQVSDGSRAHQGHKSSVGRGGHRIDASRNLWDGSGLKIDSTSTGVAWGHGVFSNKILTSARNGELIMWDLNKTGPSKYERKSKDHLRSINALSVSHIVHHYCITGSADGDLRVWDLRDMSRSLMRIHHPTSVRSVIFSPSTWHPLHAIVGLDNGSIYRWDLKNGQRGLLDRLAVAHTASVTTLDWCNRSVQSPNPTDTTGNGLGWLVSGGLDRCVKVWDLTGPSANARMPNKPSYTLHPSFPVRRVAWRPSYECELAVVSNVEFSSGSNPDLSQNNSVAAGGTGVSSEGDRHGTGSRNAIGGDPVEIWDVRRGWIPKWSVTGSAGESGVTDLVFGDSDAIWTQNSSGTFSQIDLRHCTKPVDAITRTAATWEASGSLTFVADAEAEWQIPYDDVHPDRRFLAEKQHIKLKALGDERFSPISQDLGTFNSETANDNEVFNRLARSFVFIGEDRPTICAVNARVAFQTQREHLAQTWLLLGASLTDIVPAGPPDSSKPPTANDNQPLPNSPHVSAMTPTSYTFPASVSNPTELRKTSPSHLAARSVSASTSRKMTPASSNASSPRQNATALPSIAARRPSVFSTRENGDSDLSRRSSISMYRRPSMIAQGSPSPADKTGSLRHVGEGALDDSDSSASGSGGGDEAMHGGYSDEESNAQALLSPGLLPARGIAAPSPLSRVAGQQRWTEDEAEERDRDNDGDDDDSESSPSPRSTDSESSGPSLSIVRRKNSQKSTARPLRRHHPKSRSRSSTVAARAAPMPALISLVRQDSRSSIRTITAGEIVFGGQEAEAGVKPDDTVRDMTGAMHERHRSMPVSELTLERAGQWDLGEDGASGVDPSELTDRRIEMVTADEKRFRDLAWAALREALERFADEGDIQMCAMLAVVAPDELGISKRRAARFLEAYIDLLTRRRLHACSASLRKYCKVEDISTTTLLETTIYTSCGRCRKAIVFPAGSSIPDQTAQGGYAYCASCQAPSATCAICRLPVRTLFFQCAICSHGGHQACYRAYYAQLPMADLPRSSDPEPPAHTDTDTAAAHAPTRHRTSSSTSTEEDFSTGATAAATTTTTTTATTATTAITAITAITATATTTATTTTATTATTAATMTTAATTTAATTTTTATTATPLHAVESSRSLETSSPQQNLRAAVKLAGYRCAAGCGHFCWAASVQVAV